MWKSFRRFMANFQQRKNLIVGQKQILKTKPLNTIPASLISCGIGEIQKRILWLVFGMAMKCCITVLGAKKLSQDFNFKIFALFESKCEGKIIAPPPIQEFIR